MTTAAGTEITTAAELVGLLGEPNERAANKGRTALLDVDRDWLAASPFYDDLVVKGHRPVLAVVVDIEELDAYYGPTYEEGLYR